MLTAQEMPANFVPVTNAVLSEMARRGVSRCPCDPQPDISLTEILVLTVRVRDSNEIRDTAHLSSEPAGHLGCHFGRTFRGLLL